MTRHTDIILKNLEAICGCTSAAREAATTLRELIRQHQPMTPAQRLNIAETVQHLDFNDNFLNSVAVVITLTEAHHGITQ